MNSIAGYDIGWALAPFLLLAVIFFGGTIVVTLMIWLIYTIIWKGVKRGLEEYYGPGAYRGFTPPEPGANSAQPAQVGEHRHRTGRLSR